MASIGLVIEPDRAAVAALQAAFARLRATGRDLRRPLARIGLYVQRDARRRLRARLREWGPTSTRLSRSMTMRFDTVSVVVGSILRYAAIQQLGGTVTPKTVKYLAIPVAPHLRRSGVWPRDLPPDYLEFSPNAAIRIGSHSWRGPALVRKQDETIADPSEGAGVGGGKKKRRGRTGKAGEVLFALVRKVRIKGRPYLVFDSAAAQFAVRQVEAEYRRAIGGR